MPLQMRQIKRGGTFYCLPCPRVFPFHWEEVPSGKPKFPCSERIFYSVGFRGSSHDVTKIRTKKLSILLSFYFHEVLQHLKTFIYRNFRYERVLRFATEDA